MSTCIDHPLMALRTPILWELVFPAMQAPRTC